MYYLDHTATTDVHPEVRDAMVRAMDIFANPSSLHALGLEAEHLVRDARAMLAAELGTSERNVIFTSGGTESNNLAIFGTLKRGDFFVTTAVEHPSVRACIEPLRSRGVETITVGVDKEGRIDLTALDNALKKKPRLVSVMQVNNELGTIEPIDEVRERIRALSPETLFHVDGVQGFGKIPTKMNTMDLYSLSGHKIHGPKGIGALVLAKDLHLAPILHGGGQERGVRSGTENVYAIAGLAKAIELRKDKEERFERVRTLWQRLKMRLSEIPDSKILSPEDGSPYILSVAFAGIRSEVLLHMLEMEEVYISTGSACAKGKKSAVMEAIGLDAQFADGVIRISLDDTFTEKDMDAVAAIFAQKVAELREMMGGKK